MPEGQFSGTRSTYVYESDNGTDYNITLDETLGSIPGTGLPIATTANSGAEKPGRLIPRVVFWQGELDGRIVRKEIVCNATGTLYSDTSQELVIDGVTGFLTGRRGEKFTFTRLQAAPAPAA